MKLEFGKQTLQDVVKEKISEVVLFDKKKNHSFLNARKKLCEEEVDALENLMNSKMKKCNIKHMSEGYQEL